MNFNLGFYPLYGLMFGVNWSKTEFLDEDYTEHQVQIALGIIIVEITWPY